MAEEIRVRFSHLHNVWQKSAKARLRKQLREFNRALSKIFTNSTDLFSKPIYNFIWRLIGSTQDAEDLTQETFLKVHREIKKRSTARSV